MSVRKRVWITRGEKRSAWVVDYVDSSGVRRLKTFEEKSDAKAFAKTMRVMPHVGDKGLIKELAGLRKELAALRKLIPAKPKKKRRK